MKVRELYAFIQERNRKKKWEQIEEQGKGKERKHRIRDHTYLFWICDRRRGILILISVQVSLFFRIWVKSSIAVNFEKRKLSSNNFED